jgi:hypothetical protein
MADARLVPFCYPGSVGPASPSGKEPTMSPSRPAPAFGPARIHGPAHGGSPAYALRPIRPDSSTRHPLAHPPDQLNGNCFQKRPKTTPGTVLKSTAMPSLLFLAAPTFTRPQASWTSALPPTSRPVASPWIGCSRGPATPGRATSNALRSMVECKGTLGKQKIRPRDAKAPQALAPCRKPRSGATERPGEEPCTT